MKIVRTKTKAEGGITPQEKVLMDEHAKLWIRRAMRTTPIEPDKILPAIRGLYATAGLKEPRVVIVPSPLVMAFAFGSASVIWYLRSNPAAATDAATDAAARSATLDATLDATYAATADATLAATRAATDAATRAATHAAADAAADAATRAATDAATRAATADATRAAADAATHAATRAATAAATRAATDAAVLALECAKCWWNCYQGGNMWAGYECYLTAARDVLGLELPSHAHYAYWEQAAIHGGFRVLHPEFCMVCDFPEILSKDDANRPHAETGPSHRWRDGWALYHWHGVRVPAHWIEDRANLDPVEVMRESDVEKRAAGAAIIGWPKMIKHLKRKIIDGDPNTDLGALIELTFPGLPEPGRFLQAVCPRNGTIVEGVPRVSDIDNQPINTVIAAQAWRDGLPSSEYSHPLYRT